MVTVTALLDVFHYTSSNVSNTRRNKISLKVPVMSSFKNLDFNENSIAEETMSRLVANDHFRKFPRQVFLKENVNNEVILRNEVGVCFFVLAFKRIVDQSKANVPMRFLL
ncbi:hypothetical protein TNIN_129811 [Trichonephila inaurata madagascariensis]|uniref:Uncharacterized protein n=1 Tax=Trichonephila inaurata madagascariensis TaxID=2747483 RepID=A0A8X6M7W1_9ARAC|nr:hypothetical protein TNIN_129811 [Trichonephila inaurata madagascariensis]